MDAGQPVDQSQLHTNIGYLCTRVASQVKRDFAAHQQQTELTAVEFSILTLIASSTTINQKQLCQALDISPPRLAVIIDRLETRRMVRRIRGTEDRRETYLHLLTAGRSAFENARESARVADSIAAKPLSIGEHHMLVELLQKAARLRK